MAACFQIQQSIVEDDSIVLFSTSESPEEESMATTSPSSSSFYHSPSRGLQTCYKLATTNLSFTICPNKSMFSMFTSLFHEFKPDPVSKILKSVSFEALSSEILAIVGASGTGKSTLLRVISGRVKDKEFDPKSVLVNDKYVTSPVQLRKLCGFVPQEDDLLPLLTVKETLLYCAHFKLQELSAKDKEERVMRLMNELGLLNVGDSFVGDDENRGISGGERKRLSIGVEIIHDPPILCLDEPTSGLDSNSALQVIEMLSFIAKNKQRTVVLSIHQPSYRILQYISRFLILSRGSAVHNGSLESLEGTISKLGFQVPEQLNALEFAMEIVTNLEELSKSTLESSESYPCTDWVGEEIKSDQENINIRSSYFLSLREIMFLCSRFWKVIYRTKQLFLARTMQALVGGLGLGSVYIKLRRDEGGIAERLGLFAFSLSFLLSSTVEALPVYLQERRVLMKEASRRFYKVSSYMVANTIIFLPFLFVVAIIFSVPLYWIVGLNPSVSAFAFFTFMVWMIVLMASSLVMFLSAVSPDFISGNSLICMVLGAFFLFSGYFIPKENIPKYWIFMYYVSLYRYPLDSLLINEYWSMRSDCFSHSNRTGQCFITGNDVLKSRGLDKDTRWINVVIMFSFFLLYRFTCWVVLVRRVSKTTI